MHWQSFLVGALGLALLEAVVSSTSSASTVGSFLAGVGGFAQKFVSPAYPGLSPAKASTSSTTTTSAVAPAGAVPAPPAISPAGTGTVPADYPFAPIGSGIVAA